MISQLRKHNARAGIPADLDKVLSFSKVILVVPRIKILRLFYKPRKLTKREYCRLNAKREEIQKKIIRLQHVASLVELVILRNTL